MITTYYRLDLGTLELCARISLDTASTFTPKESESIAGGTGSIAHSMSLDVAFLPTELYSPFTHCSIVVTFKKNSIVQIDPTPDKPRRPKLLVRGATL